MTEIILHLNINFLKKLSYIGIFCTYLQEILNNKTMFIIQVAMVLKLYQS